jgi:hypothetical protein
MIYYILTALVIVLQLIDMATTMHILGRGGYEANPVMDKLFKLVGVKAGLTIKVAWVSAIALILLHYEPIGVVILALMYIAVVAWNLYQVFYVMRAK